MEGIFPLKISQDFASENAAPEGMWVGGGRIELPYKLTICMVQRNTSTVQGMEFDRKIIIIRSDFKFFSFCTMCFVWHSVVVNKPAVIVGTLFRLLFHSR